ncbi:ubiquinone/menaquinone biosynthesis C-methylase UbiE [Kitasatospora sp. MAP12-15]|uniref:class I SAM-dependent methyltransferase n=1 Tax=unclassified Kitasatospora TaxID=2633591 RepID=UPI002476C8B9|nr:class I SAM-dependent methyltransferase [Kitasatospora sp. MAP12-44]MDH6113786.1 ubiquinone/menaquinone biosynthesis C-methylase UbiE [Kitasatospora sp. MAP12-44]
MSALSSLTSTLTSSKHRKAVRRVAAGTAVAAAVGAWWAFDSAPYPYAQHWLLDLPLPFLSLRRLDGMLQSKPGERILEIGPGTGLQSLHVAPQLGATGRLDIVDIQQPMLDHVMRRAAEQGIAAIHPTLADAHLLPFEDATFDAAYLVTALGEIPDPTATLRELRRVLKPSGRLVVGEFMDRHQIRPARLIGHAEEAGLRVGKLIGPPFAYYARLRPYVQAIPDLTADSLQPATAGHLRLS